MDYLNFSYSSVNWEDKKHCGSGLRTKNIADHAGLRTKNIALQDCEFSGMKISFPDPEEIIDKKMSASELISNIG